MFIKLKDCFLYLKVCLKFHFLFLCLPFVLKLIWAIDFILIIDPLIRWRQELWAAIVQTEMYSVTNSSPEPSLKSLAWREEKSLVIKNMEMTFFWIKGTSMI